MPLKLIPYDDSYFSDWLDLVAKFSVDFEENFFIWNERPSLDKNSLSYLLLSENKLIASIDLKKSNEGYECVQWAILGESAENFAFFMKKISEIAKTFIQIKIANRELSAQLENAGGVSMGREYSYFLRGDAYEGLLREDGFCDHYYCIGSDEKYRTISESEALVHHEFMKPILHNFFKFNLP